jgi:hypothetical protein
MSRNLCTTVCEHCGDTPQLVEIPHLITEKEAGVYFPEYEGTIVAKAICPSCEAQYLAWVDESHRVHYPANKCYPVIEDLSYYSTFNDEPGETDLPKYEVQRVFTRVAKIR